MRIAEMNWAQVEALLAREDRAVLPLGSTEQHATLSLATDSILAERVAADAAEPLGVPVFPAIAYGFTPNFMAYPGTVTLKLHTLSMIVRDVLDSLAAQGFRRILIVNGHGGNAPARSFTHEWMASHPGVRVRFHDWWNAPRVWAKVQSIDPVASHASWMENFPWTRLEGVELPETAKPMVAVFPDWTPAQAREALGDGSFGGAYQRPDGDMQQLWSAAVAEIRALLDSL